MKKVRYFLMFILVGAVYADEVSVPLLHQDAVLGFGDFLFEDGELYRAVTEYKRFLFLFPESPMEPYVRLQLARAYHQGQQFSEARRHARMLRSRFPDSPEARRIPLLVAATFRAESDPGLAAMSLESYFAANPASRDGHLAALLAGLEFLRAGEPEASREMFYDVPEDSDFRGMAVEFSGAVDELESLSLKRPWLAGTLSAVLPGAGQLYVGTRSDALVSFLLNGLIFYAAYEAFDREQYAAGTLLGSIGIGWYSGNIYNAVNGAHKENRRRRDRFIEQIDLRVAPLLLQDEPALSFGTLYRF